MYDLEIALLKGFNDLYFPLEEWGKIVDSEIIDILAPTPLNHEMKIKPSFRRKEPRSFLSKALWRNKNKYADPLLELEDKIGTRLVLLKSDDIYPTAELFLNYKGWESKTTKDLKGSIDGAPREFNYQSYHIVVWPKSDDSRFDKNIIPLLTCEIQIRTLLQHAFAEISHDSTYKGPYRNDKDLIRMLSKAMALMEVTDDYFIEMFQMMTDNTRKLTCYMNELTFLFQKYRPEYKQDNSDVTLADILFILLEKKEISIDQVSDFVSQHESEIKAAVDKNKTLIFQHPVILLIGYYIYNWIDFIKEEWPLSLETLEEAFNGFGFDLN